MRDWYLLGALLHVCATDCFCCGLLRGRDLVCFCTFCCVSVCVERERDAGEGRRERGGGGGWKGDELLHHDSLNDELQLCDRHHMSLMLTISKCDYGPFDGFWQRNAQAFLTEYKWRIDAVASTCNVTDEYLQTCVQVVQPDLVERRFKSRELFLNVLGSLPLAA